MKKVRFGEEILVKNNVLTHQSLNAEWTYECPGHLSVIYLYVIEEIMLHVSILIITYKFYIYRVQIITISNHYKFSLNLHCQWLWSSISIIDVFVFNYHHDDFGHLYD